MVKKVSSLLRLPNERRIPVARNHTDIVKFHDQSDPTYRTVVAHIQKCIDATVRSPTRIGARLEGTSDILCGFRGTAHLSIQAVRQHLHFTARYSIDFYPFGVFFDSD
jgi:hypothetical protein